MINFDFLIYTLIFLLSSISDGLSREINLSHISGFISEDSI